MYYTNIILGWILACCVVFDKMYQKALVTFFGVIHNVVTLLNCVNVTQLNWMLFISNLRGMTGRSLRCVRRLRVQEVLCNGWCLFHSAFLMFLNLEINVVDMKVMCMRTFLHIYWCGWQKLDVKGMNHGLFEGSIPAFVFYPFVLIACQSAHSSP